MMELKEPSLGQIFVSKKFWYIKKSFFKFDYKFEGTMVNNMADCLHLQSQT